MKIAVTVKLAAALDETAVLRDGAVDESDLEWDINEWDMFAVEAALELRDAAGEGEVVIVSVGGDQVPEGLLTCLAMGADRAVHVDVEDEAQTLDAIAVARLLAAVIGRESPDLVLSGVQSSDFAGAATGTALAGLLELPHVAVVRDVVMTDGALEVQRELEGGLIERLRIKLPAALTVQTGINEPRYATLRSIRQASGKERTSVAPADLGFDDAALAALPAARVTALAEPPVRTSASMIEGGAGEIAAQIVSIVKARIA
jgi:electron transfer flavoprotein beta subunit